jgi:protein-disulfide isomerase
MQKKYLILPIILLLTITTPAFALNKDEQIYTSFKEILDREPTMGEYHYYIKGYKGKEYVKKSLNQTDERKEVIKNIYQQALKRNPRRDELEALIKFVAPNNLIRQQLYESNERRLAIIDAYRKFLGRSPMPNDLEFYVATRSPFAKIKEVLNNSEERKIALANKYKQEFGAEPNPNELAHMIENKILLDDVVGVKVLGIEYVEPPKKDGPVAIVVFNDFECLYCGEFYQTMKKIKQFYSTQIKIEIKHFPLPFHQKALKAALAYECANEQGVGKQMTELIYQARIDEEMSAARWKKEALNLEINTEQFNKCLDNDKYLDKIQADITEGESLGVSGTPTIFIEEEKILGNISLDDFGRKIREYLIK